MKKYDLTVIICATNLISAYKVCQNIQSTSGLACQFLLHDNSRTPLPLAKVYNKYSKIAKSEYILFAHQDIHFIGQNWGKHIVSKLNESDVGCIGFAGSVYRPKNYYAGWPINVDYSICNYIKNTNSKVYRAYNAPFDEVVIIDGLAMFVKRTVAMENKFDEDMLDGFHCYDIDFSLSLFSKGYKNYVFTNADYSVFHASPGKYSAAWIQETIKLTNLKWNDMTPAIVKNYDCAAAASSIEKNNIIFTYIIKNFFTIDVAKNLISQLKISKSKMTIPMRSNTHYISDGYRSWN